MRVRKLSVLFLGTCLIGFSFLLYSVSDLSDKLPNIRPSFHATDEEKWTQFETKLFNIEKQLLQHRAVVGQIKSAVEQIVEQSEDYHDDDPKNDHKQVLQKPNLDLPKWQPAKQNELFINETEMKNKNRKFNVKTKDVSDIGICPSPRNIVPKTDIQMLSLYQRTIFDDKDGGVWKQGWNIEYEENQWSQKNKLKVFIVPHSHNDPGWLKTFENYYKTQTKAIFKNMVEKLAAGIGRKFIWAEISFLSLWWTNDATEEEKQAFRRLLDSGQIEIVTGGWVMNDEANSHWLSIVQQLTTGHQWVLDHLGYIPKNTWSIDPFGYSSSQPYLLKLAGFENSVIQRVHYRVKKELAQHKQLEFKWRQLWDAAGDTDMFTHMMPFYSYDIPHTCGPDPKVCCQFDFKRLPGNGIACPWGIQPRKIIQKNVAERSYLILDQWRKKAQVYRSNVVLIPLGDDFRYDRATEWDQQYENYEKIIDYINNRDEWNAEVQFGTLQDYFKALHEEVKLSDFPVLSGDFFTYADRTVHYWSGYYTSRPFYKNMDRALLAYVRAAEIISTQAATSNSISYIMWIQLRDRVEAARRSLALFQHHDGITGTARDEVREDYAKKLLQGIKYCQSAIQQSAYYLLKQPAVLDQNQPDIHFDVDDIWQTHDEVPTRITINLDVLSPSRRIVLYNALAFRRHEVLTVVVSSPHVEVYDPDGNPMMAQISPVVSGEGRLGFASNKFLLSFPVTVNALSLTIYSVSLRDAMSINKYTSYARINVYNADYWNIDLPKMFALNQPAARLSEDITIRAGNGTKVVTNMNGLVKAIVSPDGATSPVHMDYIKYDTMKGPDMNSGAYLFVPSGPGQLVKFAPYPEIVTTEGPYRSNVYSALRVANSLQIILTLSVYDNPSLVQSEVEVSNTLQIDHQVDDIEVAMRFSTLIKNEDVFYTDLNGMQMIKRRYFAKLPLQANFYPLPAATYIEDDNNRFTVLTSTPLGMAALQPGDIEIMQDRRLSRDDNRGLSQGVVDNIWTRHTFKIIVEKANKQCENKIPSDHPSGFLTVGTHISQQTLLQPLVVMLYTAHEDSIRPSYTSQDPIGVADLVLATARAQVTTKNKEGKILQGTGMTFQRVQLDVCYGNSRDITLWYPTGDGKINISNYLKVPTQEVYEATLTFAHTKDALTEGVFTLCPMEMRSIFVNKTLRD